MSDFDPAAYLAEEDEFNPEEYLNEGAAKTAYSRPGLPQVRGAAPGESDVADSVLSAPSTPKVDVSVGKVGAALNGTAQGGASAWADEAGGALFAPFSSPSAQQKQTWAEDGVEPSFKDWIVANYENERSGQRRMRDRSAADEPGVYGTSLVGGGIAQSVATNALTGGQASTPWGNFIQGAVAGSGASDADFLSKDNAKATLAGGVIGATVGKASKHAPAATAATLGGLGVTAAAFGDKIGMSKADRVAAGVGGTVAAVTAATMAAQKAGNVVSKKFGSAETKARGQVQGKLEAKDAASEALLDKENAKFKAAGMKAFDTAAERLENQAKIPDAPDTLQQKQGREYKNGKEFIDTSHAEAFKGQRRDEKILDKALRRAGKEKFKAFDDMVGDESAKRKGAEESSDKALVEAMQAEESGVVPGKGASNANEIADFEASIPQRVENKEHAEFGALVNRVSTFKMSGRPVPPDLDAHVDDVIAQYEKNTPGFLERFLRQKDPKALAEGYREELLAKLADMKAGVGTQPGMKRDTQVSVPSPERLMAAQKPAEGPRARVPMMEQRQLAREQDLLPENVEPRVPDYYYEPQGETGRFQRYKLEGDVDREKARIKALDKLLGFSKADPGEQPDPSVLFNDSEEIANIAESAGVGHIRPKAAVYDELNKMNIDRQVKEGLRPPPRGPKTVAAPGASGPLFERAQFAISGDESMDDGLRLVDQPGWPKWSQISSPDAPPANDSGKAFEHYKSLNNAADPVDDFPLKSRAPFDISKSDPMHARVDSEVSKSKLSLNPMSAVRAVVSPRGAAMSAAGAATSEGNPELRAKVYGALQRTLSSNPALQEKYGQLFAGAATRADLLAMVASFPELADLVKKTLTGSEGVQIEP
jgi:hypothetical protein